ncbi:ATP-binding protein [Streptomyces sp. NPDC021080]|uniref:ATP-binding protein n=1 Tax=Streptomyces sp. NPDC021080 TaxID=3365110 RepID=UPI0037BD6644
MGLPPSRQPNTPPSASSHVVVPQLAHVLVILSPERHSPSRWADTPKPPGSQPDSFPPDFLPHAFDRFSRAEASRTTPGAGLGLALVAAVAASHGGTARAENIPPGATGTGGVTGAAVTLDVPC